MQVSSFCCKGTSSFFSLEEEIQIEILFMDVVQKDVDMVSGVRYCTV